MAEIAHSLSIGWKGHSHHFLGFPTCDCYRLFAEKKDTTFDAVLKEKRFRLQRKKVLSHHKSAPVHSPRIVMFKLNELTLRISLASSIFTGPSLKRLFRISKPEKKADRKEICLK